MNNFKDWLISLNTKYTRAGILHSNRAEKAEKEFELLFNAKLPATGPERDLFNKFFVDHVQIQEPTLGPIYYGAYFYDGCFWKITIPLIFGNVNVYPEACLKKCPESIKFGIKSDGREFMKYLRVWADCIDFAYGYDDLFRKKHPSDFKESLIFSGRQFMDSTVTLLLDRHLNPKSIEQARMAAEMFFKAFLSAHAGLDEKAAKKYSHDLNKLHEAAQSIDKSKEFAKIADINKAFPPIESRYSGNPANKQEIWQSYRIAQFIGATLTRSITKRNTTCLYVNHGEHRAFVPIR